MATAERVCAVVVTYNRKEMLGGCLDALLQQTHPLTRIVVVDNASTDGTPEFLQDRGYRDNPTITYLRLPENGGGAGGFHAGFEHVVAHEPFDWLWAMDDDGLAEPRTLEHLLDAPASAGQFRGPLVLAREEIGNPHNDQLAFPGGAETEDGVAPLRTATDVRKHARDGVLQGYACLFNGVLIHRVAVGRIGLPNAQFFIWGDEWDYFFRAKELGVTTNTVVNAFYWHPLDRTKRAKIRMGWLEYEVPCASDAFRNYLLIRNHAYLAGRYRGAIAWMRHVIKYIVYHRTADGCFSAWQVLRYSIEGLRGRFHGRGSFESPQPPASKT